jgi:hypothetical protein
MAQLTGSNQPVPLGNGYVVRAPGLRGSAELRLPPSTAERARSRSPDDGTPELDAALAAARVTEVRRVEVTLQPPRPGAAAASLRSADGRQDAFELEVPDLGPETGQVVLACDEAGVLTWHLPIGADGHLPVGALTGAAPTTRGGAGTRRFRVPATVVTPPPGADPTSRSLIGIVGRKLLKVLVYPITDPVLGAVGEAFAERWEARQRPYGLRDFAPGSFRQPSADRLGDGDWSRLARGRALLFLHGTFSTSHAAFARLPDAVLAALHDRYGGRVFAFDHPTIAHDPLRNVRWLDDHLAATALDVDIVSHSRGGLVARTLAERPASFGLGAPRLRVGTVVLVGVPNAGTPLADAAHMVAMLDRFTTALNLFPSGPVAETLEAIVTVVKVLGHGLLRGLDGLAAMSPGSAFLSGLNAAGASGERYHAIAADFEPNDEGLRALLTGAANAVLDRVFGDTANDLVVPEPGVYQVEGSSAFPIPPGRLERVPASQGVDHTTLFAHPPVGERLLGWLPG